MSAPPDLDHQLTPHPSSRPGPVREISVSARRHGDYLLLRYRLVGDLDGLLLPAPRKPARTDELWRHTCLEAFVGQVDSTEYCEYNFSPSGAWAAYHFTGHRAGMRPHGLGAAPAFSTRVDPGALLLDAKVDLGGSTLSGGRMLRLGVTAVVEDLAGVLSYWALKHPAEQPDFHHADSFVIVL